MFSFSRCCYLIIDLGSVSSRGVGPRDLVAVTWNRRSAQLFRLSQSVRHFLHQHRSQIPVSFFADFLRRFTLPGVSPARSQPQKISLLNACIVLIFFIAGLLFCALSTSNIGSVSHPAGDRPSPSHLIHRLLETDPIPKFLRGFATTRIVRNTTSLFVPTFSRPRPHSQ